MLKTKMVLFQVAVFLSSLTFANAAGLPATPAADKTDIKAVCADVKAEARALKLLTSIAPAIEFLDALTAQKVEAAPLVLGNEKVIEPGRDLAPKVEDAVRIKAILKLVSDIYNNVHLPYSQDGATFTNKEGRLPKQALGFYKEYTLLTGSAPHTVVIDGQTYQVAPDLSARGSERVIIGGGATLYYTPDHYAHFIQLTVVRN